MADQPEKSPTEQNAAKSEDQNKAVPPDNNATPAQKPAAPNDAPRPGEATPKPDAASAEKPKTEGPSTAPVPQKPEPAKPPTPTVPLKDASPVSTTRDLRDYAKESTIPGKGTMADQSAKKEETQISSSSQAKPTQRFPQPSPEGGSQSAMQICPTCGHRNRPGVLICDNCGTNLMTGSKTAVGTRDLVKEQEEQKKESPSDPLLDTAQVRAIESAGGATFTEDMVLRVEIEGGTTPMMVYPKNEIIMGRRDPNTGGMPDVDLTSYAGYRMGVSRRHAAIRLQEKQLNLSDLGSSNGTFLNGTRLNAHRPYQVRDGDEIRLGQMVLRVYFQSAKDKK
jgi:hypothetical protein